MVSVMIKGIDKEFYLDQFEVWDIGYTGND